MAVLTFSARTILAQYLIQRPLFLAIGTGKASWDTEVEPPEYEAKNLINEVGYKKLTTAFFVNEDDDGKIDLPGGRRFSPSDVPTRHIYLCFDFNYGEGISTPIREVGIYADTKIKAGLPETQSYFTPAQIQNAGTLILIEHLEAADTFTPNKKGIYGTVLSI